MYNSGIYLLTSYVHEQISNIKDNVTSQPGNTAVGATVLP